MFMQPIVPVVAPVIVRRRQKMDPFGALLRHHADSVFADSVFPRHPLGYHHGFDDAFDGMSRMLDALAGHRGAFDNPASHELPPDDHAFLHPDHGATSDAQEEATATHESRGESDSGVVSQSYSFSSIRHGGEPAVEQTVRKVVTADGQERTVMRKRLGEQELVVRRTAPDTELHRALEGGTQATDGEAADGATQEAIDKFEQEFEEARSGKLLGRQQLESRTLDNQEQVEGGNPPEAAQPARTDPTTHDAGFSFGDRAAPVSTEQAQPVDPKQVALVKEVVPELDDSEVAALLQKHAGDVRAVLREQLSRL